MHIRDGLKWDHIWCFSPTNYAILSKFTRNSIAYSWHLYVFSYIYIICYDEHLYKHRLKWHLYIRYKEYHINDTHINALYWCSSYQNSIFYIHVYSLLKVGIGKRSTLNGSSTIIFILHRNFHLFPQQITFF